MFFTTRIVISLGFPSLWTSSTWWPTTFTAPGTTLPTTTRRWRPGSTTIGRSTPSTRYTTIWNTSLNLVYVRLHLILWLPAFQLPGTQQHQHKCRFYFLMYWNEAEMFQSYFKLQYNEYIMTTGRLKPGGLDSRDQSRSRLIKRLSRRPRPKFEAEYLDRDWESHDRVQKVLTHTEINQF